MKSHRILLLFILLCFSSNTLYSQIAEDKFSERLESARKLFISGTYYAAEQAFNELSQSIDDEHSFKKSEIEAYQVLCAIALDRVNIDGLVKVFEANYPAAPELAIVKFTLATHFFDKGEYPNALNVFKTLQPKHLYKSQEPEFLFKYSYCNMRVGQYKESTSGFKKIIDSEFSQYTYPSIYYLGYVYYLDKNFTEAYPLFERAIKDSRFTLMASYYAIESKFMLKDYDYVIDNGPNLYNKLERDLQTYLARIVSESYFSKGLPDLAQKYFDQYATSGTQLSRKDHYYSGILSYTLKSYLSAIASFERVVGVNDTLSQNAYYYTANSYLMTKNKIAALSAFKIASESDFDPVIKEDAMFNFAKLSFDVNSDISQFQRYIELYPKSGKDDVINTYMAAAFLLRKDYASAVTALQKIKHLSTESSANLQKAAFFRAMQLIENKGYRSAIPMLELSISHGSNNESLFNLAQYWLAECNYRNDKYTQAASLNAQLVNRASFMRTKEYPNAIYNLAYCYFKGENFEQSQNWFSNYLNNQYIDRRFEKDARVRLGDSYFMQKKYAEAAPVYEAVFTKYYTSDDIYPAFQSAVSYGLLGNDTKKISILKRVVKNNRDAALYPKALFELGRTYVQKGDDDNASECFYTLLGHKSDSAFFSKSLLELAMINSNNGKYSKAIELYKEIIEEIPYAPEVQDAISGMESIYQTMNRPEEFLSYLDELGLSSIKTADEKELMRFTAAEQIYLSGNYPAAMNSLQSFISSYPTGAKSAQAYFYLAEALKATGRKEAAADAYMQVMKMGEGSFAENATNNYAKISYELGHYSKAIDAYQTLSYIAKTDEMKNVAYFGRMRSYYGNKQYSNALKDAQRIVNSSGVSPDIVREAKYLMAKSYLVLGDRDLAKPVFEDLALNYDDAIGAESAYILILDAYDAADFANVEKRVYAFSDAGTKQVYWLAKSFIVLGDSFADREEWEQAKATFESVMKGYQAPSEGDDIKDQIKMRINRINSLEKAK